MSLQKIITNGLEWIDREIEKLQKARSILLELRGEAEPKSQTKKPPRKNVCYMPSQKNIKEVLEAKPLSIPEIVINLRKRFNIQTNDSRVGKLLTAGKKRRFVETMDHKWRAAQGNR